MTNERAGITLFCQGCGWALTLPFTDDNTVAIEAVDGWSIDPEDEVLVDAIKRRQGKARNE